MQKGEKKLDNGGVRAYYATSPKGKSQLRRKADMKRTVTMMMFGMCMGMMSMCMFRRALKGHPLSDNCLTA